MATLSTNPTALKRATCSTLLVALFALTATSAAEVVQDANIPVMSQGQQYTYQPPDLSDEESHSLHVPEHLKCYACMAICTMMSQQLSYAQKRNPHSEKLPESELYDALEAACHPDVYEMFGIKEVDGRKKLTGSGMPDGLAPGFMMTGGWKVKLASMCGSYLGRFEEEKIYNQWRQLKNENSLAALLCYNKLYQGFSDTCIAKNRANDEL